MMRTDTELKLQALEILNRELGLVETERFIMLMQRERFDYTIWRQNLFSGLSGAEISHRAMAFSEQTRKQNE